MCTCQPAGHFRIEKACVILPAFRSAEFGPLIESFAAGVTRWASEHADQLSSAAAAVVAGLGGKISAEHVCAHCLRVIHYDWIISPSRWV